MEKVMLICGIVYLTVLLVASVHAVESERDATTTLFKYAPLDEGVFKYAFETSNGITVQSAGSAFETLGIYSYVSPEGTPIEARYIADELGFHVVGRHLPQPQPIPDYILRSIEYIKSHAKQETDATK